ncbi:hypothetical protein ACH5RR_040040 [Cinchona calisaya]|uniref:Uncharacterized protein n=1 Tax=Cinchona calisaya TaxID=153742 RepID=A0ABD2XRR4_9GENT
MGGVAVLQPQDLFNHRHNLISPAMKTHSLSRNHPAVNRSSHRRKRSPEKNTRSRLQSPAKPTTINIPVMGQVKILKRGETLPLFSDPKVDEETITCTSTSDDENTEKALVRPPKKQILTIYDGYAGTAFITSPPPCSLPVPAFFKKKNLVLTNDRSNNNNDATSDILRLLRLDLS